MKEATLKKYNKTNWKLMPKKQKTKLNFGKSN